MITLWYITKVSESLTIFLGPNYSVKTNTIFNIYFVG